MNLNDLKQQRAKLIVDARAILDRASNEKRELSAEEDAQYNAHHAQIRALWAQHEREREQAELDAEIEAIPTPGTRSQPERADKGISFGEYRHTPREMMTLEGGQAETRRAQPAFVSAFRSALKNGPRALTEPEFRALQADSDVAGGNLIPPQEFVAKLLMALDNEVFIRQRATKFPLLKAESLGVPALDTDPSDADWTAELGPVQEDTAMAFGKRALSPYPLSKYIKVSRKLLRQSPINVEDLVRNRFAYKFGVTQEKAFQVGTGVGQPLGVFTASPLGISTARDISTSNTTTAVTADGIQKALWGLKPQYRKNAEWLFHTDALAAISILKDGNGQYLWQRGLQAGVPDRLANLPYMESVYAPNTFTTGLYVGILGDWSFYWIADSLAFEIQVIDQLFALTNQMAYIARAEMDGMPVMEEAFVRVKLA